MNRKASSMVVAALLFLLLAHLALAQDDTPSQEPSSDSQHTLTMQLEGESPEQALQESLSGRTLPLWPYQVRSRINGGRYTGYIVGRLPGTPVADIEGNTNIPLAIVPVVMVFRWPNGSIAYVFDPTQPDGCWGNVSPLNRVLQSPLLQNSGPYVWGNPAVNLGAGQYIDAQLRGEFWTLVQASPLPWHTRLQPRIMPTLTLNVPPAYWFIPFGNYCTPVGKVNLAWMNTAVLLAIRTLRVQGLITPGMVPLFLTKNVYTTTGPGSDIGGYHNAFGPPLQVYAVSAVDSSGYYSWSKDINILSHELGELMNDPMGQNYTPSWGHIGQQVDCQNTFEVGDPLSGANLPVINLNGFAYHVQELAMMSWFYRPANNWGVPGWYSTNGSFSADAGAVCRTRFQRVALSPANGAIGTNVTVNISGFPANSWVTITFGGNVVLQLFTNNSGRAQDQFMVPQNAVVGPNEVDADSGTYHGEFFFVVPD